MIDITGLREDKRPQSSTIVHALLDRLEAAEKERDALRAKVEQMERQEPIAWTTKLALELGSSALGFDACRGNLWGEKGVSLYALPGAQNVPAPLLVAITDLVAQMEIVARVGFVDTPDDKDSCAAFCVAEGTWLELVGCVKSLAAALAAAAPGAKS